MTESAAPQPEDTVVAAPAAAGRPRRRSTFRTSAHGLARRTNWHVRLRASPPRCAGSTGPLLDLVQQQSTLKLFFLWMGTIVISGLCYWLGARAGEHGLIEGGRPVGGDFNGFISAIYFSFVTATSIGYGDIVPVGFARVDRMR